MSSSARWGPAAAPSMYRVTRSIGPACVNYLQHLGWMMVHLLHPFRYLQSYAVAPDSSARHPYQKPLSGCPPA